MEKKNHLTNEVRQAGISEGDEAFLDSFSEEMQKKNDKNKKNQLADKETKSNKKLYQPTDQEIDDKLKKAKNIDKNIFKDTHPEEYKKQIQLEEDKKKKE